MELNEKQLKKVEEIRKTVSLTAADDALEAFVEDQKVSDLKAARKLVAKELRKIDKALAVYEIDLAHDEAKAVVEKATGKTPAKGKE